MTAPNMDIVRPTIVRTETLSLPLATALQASASPDAILPLIQGEWLTRAGDVWARPGTGGGAEITVPMWPNANQRGATTVQAALRTSAFVPPYEAWTLVWDALVAPPTAYGQALTVAVMAGGTYAGYAAILRVTGAGYALGFAVGTIPTATGQRLYYRANY
jgi:hypothetical protein